MKKIIMAVSFLLALTHCVSMKAIEGKYPKNDTFQTEKSKEIIWTKIIQFFAQSGIEPTLLDKPSWFITAKSSISAFSMECEKDGKVSEKAYFVTSCLDDGFKLYPPNAGSYKFNIRLTTEKNITSVNINTFGEAIYDYPAYKGTKFDVLTTSKLEKELFEYLNK